MAHILIMTTFFNFSTPVVTTAIEFSSEQACINAKTTYGTAIRNSIPQLNKLHSYTAVCVPKG